MNTKPCPSCHQWICMCKTFREWERQDQKYHDYPNYNDHIDPHA